MNPDMAIRSPRRLMIIAYIALHLSALLLPLQKSYCAEDPYNNSCGAVTFRFDPVKIKIYNEKKQVIGFSTLSSRTAGGFLIRHESEVYFITVALPARIVKDGRLLPYENDLFYEILEERKSPAQVTVTLPTGGDIQLALNKGNSVGDNRIKERRRLGEREEKIDLLCIKLTGDIPALSNSILSYEQLAGESDKPALGADPRIEICGYPGGQITQGYRQEPTTITSPGTFATLSAFNGQDISGFSFALKLEESDAGRPVRAIVNNQDMIIGVVKEKLFSENGEYIGGVAIDSTAIKRIIDALHRKLSRYTPNDTILPDIENS